MQTFSVAPPYPLLSMLQWRKLPRPCFARSHFYFAPLIPLLHRGSSLNIEHGGGEGGCGYKRPTHLFFAHTGRLMVRAGPCYVHRLLCACMHLCTPALTAYIAGSSSVCTILSTNCPHHRELPYMHILSIWTQVCDQP
jgi:hypothetical protein